MELDPSFDAVVLGTGLIESIVAGAIARTGRKVLHLDKNGHYGGSAWPSFTLDELQRWAEAGGDDKLGNVTTDDHEAPWGVADTTSPGMSAHPLPEPTGTLSGTYILTNTLTEDESALLASSSRRIALDLSPRLLLASGPAVDALVTSGVGNYLEFKGLDAMFVLTDGQLMTVPGSREEVFRSKDLSLPEKRLLMRFLNRVGGEEADALAEWQDRPMTELLDDAKLTPRLQDMILHGLVMDGNATVAAGLDVLQTFLGAVGRFHSGAWLVPLYGTCEIVQAYCRMCAVKGGTYMLRKAPRSLLVRSDPAVDQSDPIVDSAPAEPAVSLAESIIDSVVATIADPQEPRPITPPLAQVGAVCGVGMPWGQPIASRWLVAGADYLPLLTPPKPQTSRAICLTDGPMCSDLGRVCIVLPATPQRGTVTILQLDSSACVCPPGLCVVHFTVASHAGPLDDLGAVLRQFITFDGVSPRGIPSPSTAPAPDESTLPPGWSRPRLLYGVCFHQFERATAPREPGVMVLPDLPPALSCDLPVVAARQAFEQMYPDEAFLPREDDQVEIDEEGEIPST